MFLLKTLLVVVLMEVITNYIKYVTIGVYFSRKNGSFVCFGTN